MLQITTAQRRYFAHRNAVARLSPSDSREFPPTSRPSQPFDLAPILDPADQPLHGRCHAIIIALRRRDVWLLVQRVDLLSVAYPVLPLPRLVRETVSRPWLDGVAIVEDDVVPVLDLARLARDLLFGVISAPLNKALN